MAWTSTASTELDLPNGAKVYEGTFDAICGNFGQIGGTGGVNWTTWVPTVTQGAAITLTISQSVSRIIGRGAELQAILTATSAGSSLSAIQIAGIPTTMEDPVVGGGVCVGSFIVTAATIQYVGSVEASSSGMLRFRCDQTGGYLGITPSFALANTDVIGFRVGWPIST